MSKAGFYNGRHYTEWVESVNDLKRDGDLNGAIVLLGHLIEATEAEATAQRDTPAPGYCSATRPVLIAGFSVSGGTNEEVSHFCCSLSGVDRRGLRVV